MSERQHSSGVTAGVLARVALVIVLGLPHASTLGAGIHDLRAVIDISGSMKETDPQNLRIPALRLLTELLPPGTDAGVWTFGQWVNMLVPHGEVTNQWKDRARAEAVKINSVALFTDIGQALQRATHDWRQAAAGRRRSLILLTDGRVDIDKNPEINTRARAQIVQEHLPRLIEAGAVLYPVGLSDNVDHELLAMLARETGGLYQTARNADDLHGIFVRILEQSARANTLPVVEGGFQVDDSIEELNIVVFRGEEGGRVALRDPVGSEMEHTSRPEAVRWFEEPRYAVITIPDPRPGRWEILADPNPDNRVFVVSRLRLIPDPLPANLVAGEELALGARLVDGETPIQDAAFLALLDARTVIEHEDSPPVAWPLRLGGEPGGYQGSARFATHSGTASVRFIVEGPTFQRSVRQLVTLEPPPVHGRWEGPSWIGRTGRLVLEADPERLAPGDLAASVLWDGPGVTRHGAETRFAAGSERALLFTPEQAGAYRASVAVAGVSDQGRKVLIHIPPIAIEAVPEPHVESRSAPPPERIPLPTDVPAAPSGDFDGRWWLALAAINLLLVLAALYHALRTCRRDSAAMAERLAELDAPAAPASGET